MVKRYDNYSRIYTKTYQNVKIGKDGYKFVIEKFERTKALSSLEFIKNEYSNDNSKKNLSAIFETSVFDYSKPVSLLKFLCQFTTNENDIILDFFSGSATTAHAVMQLNAEDGSNRRFICVQLPELCDEKSEAYKAGYQNICEIGKERIRRVGTKILEVNEGQLAADGGMPPVDIGFKVFKLDSSNMKLWDDTPIDGNEVETLLDRMSGHIDGLKSDRSDEDLIYEILLKMGYDLTADVATFDVDGLTVYKVAEGEMLICLQEGVDGEHIERLAALAPQKIVLAARSLSDSSAKANAFYLLDNKGIELKTV